MNSDIASLQHAYIPQINGNHVEMIFVVLSCNKSDSYVNVYNLESRSNKYFDILAKEPFVIVHSVRSYCRKFDLYSTKYQVSNRASGQYCFGLLIFITSDGDTTITLFLKPCQAPDESQSLFCHRNPILS